MRYLLYLAVLLFALPLFAQKPDYDFVKAEKDSRRLVYGNPDSALVIIKNTLAQSGNLHDTIYGNTYNLYGIYYGMIGKPDSTLYYIKKSLTYLDKYPRNKTRSLMNLAIGYRNRGDYKLSINTLNESIAINTKENNDVGIAIAYGELASNYSYMLDYKKSVNYLLKAAAILKGNKKGTKQVPAINQKLGNTYMAMGNYKFAIDLYRESLKGFKEIGGLKNYYLTHINIAEALIQLKNYKDAEKSLNEAITGLEKFGDKEMIGISYSKIGNLKSKQKNNAKAIKAYKSAIEMLTEVRSSRLIRIAGEYIDLLNAQNDSKKALEVIAGIDKLKLFASANLDDQEVYKNATAATYEATNNDKEAIKAYKHTIAIMDSISASKREEAVRDMQAKFQTELQREKNISLEANNKVLQKNLEADRAKLLLYTIAAIAVLLVILLVLRGYWSRTRLQREALKTVEAEKSMLEQRHLHEQELTNAQREIIEEKQRELTSTALRMANYQDSVAEIVEKCDKGGITKIADVKKELQQLVKQQDYWKQFETRFNNLHPEFGTTLTNRYAKLTKNDIEFCSLLKLNLSNKEIASLLQISHESAITKKYRIKKKMEINDDDEFEKLLMDI
ncbi:transcriptional regulator [Flavobacterium sp. Sd200]|uniref:tetratricopeptide repeat protein n=1 Tax=Flavobacterium sp. Sd200 TaxID=2692211 RepID=UPI001370C0B4|nr:transcriptional regulator [Flavobacterium sp. Sd200]